MASAEPMPVAARLVLENGAIFRGQAFGRTDASTQAAGEVVFNTAMTGYQEALTDPSYSGQILVMTAPLIGNYGITLDDGESARPQVAGFVVRELARLHSNHRAVTDLSAWLDQAGVLALSGIDTRAVVRQLRSGGAMRGMISTNSALGDIDLLARVRALPPMAGRNLACGVSPETQGTFSESLGAWRPEHASNSVQQSAAVGGGGGMGHALQGPKRLRVVALDCGAKRTIYRNLVDRGCEVITVPFNTPPQTLRELKPDGLFISNGPGDPEAVQQTVATLKAVAGEVPTFGICLGHQLLALALGAKTYKLKFGHRGANQPVRNLETGKIEITSQNHGFCVEPESLAATGSIVTHLHLNDGTIAGFRHGAKPIMAVQYHPEASPGPHDSAYLFDGFVQMMAAAGGSAR